MQTSFYTLATGDVPFVLLHLSSSAFRNKEMIPEKYTCDGANVNPPLDIENIPPETVSLALVVDDPDAPVKTWLHWMVWNIPVTHHIAENSIPGAEGINDLQVKGYGGPCPPWGTHAYFFKVYALDTELNLPDNASKEKLERQMDGHLLGYGELIGLYRRHR